MLACLMICGVASADQRDRTRGLLYRVDAEAHTLRLHPSEPITEARAVERQANLAAGMLASQGLRPEARALRYQARALAEAAQRGDPEDVRQHAITVERLVREVDDALPGPEISH
jgi:hypothetical protein